MQPPFPERRRQYGDDAEWQRRGEPVETFGDPQDVDPKGHETLPFFGGVPGVAPAETDHEIVIQGADTREPLPDTRGDRLDAVLADIRMQLDVNHEGGSNPIYAGFEFVRTNQAPSPEEGAYVGAFLPLRVAEKFPELLLNSTITHDDVYCSDQLPRGTRVVVRPGVFSTLGRNRFLEIIGSPIAFCLYLLAASVAAAYLARLFPL